MAQHTEGPWFYTGEGKDAYGIVERDGTNIMHMQTLQNSTGARRMESNMRLIAASPCMFKLLKEARERVEQNIKSLIESHTVPSTGLLEGDAVLAVEAEQDFLNEIDAVIAKATT